MISLRLFSYELALEKWCRAVQFADWQFGSEAWAGKFPTRQVFIGPFVLTASKVR